VPSPGPRRDAWLERRSDRADSSNPRAPVRKLKPPGEHASRAARAALAASGAAHSFAPLRDRLAVALGA
jgi:hypothetical protein